MDSSVIQGKSIAIQPDQNQMKLIEEKVSNIVINDQSYPKSPADEQLLKDINVSKPKVETQPDMSELN